MYDKNCIKKGKVNFFWGSSYEGNFDSVENFSNGVLIFLNGDRFYGDWVGGKLKSGKLITQNGKTRIINDKNKKIFNYDRDTGYGVLIKHDSNSIYEGKHLQSFPFTSLEYLLSYQMYQHMNQRLSQV